MRINMRIITRIIVHIIVHVILFTIVTSGFPYQVFVRILVHRMLEGEIVDWDTCVSVCGGGAQWAHSKQQIRYFLRHNGYKMLNSMLSVSNK